MGLSSVCSACSWNASDLYHVVHRIGENVFNLQVAAATMSTAMSAAAAAAAEDDDPNNERFKLLSEIRMLKVYSVNHKGQLTPYFNLLPLHSTVRVHYMCRGFITEKK